MKILKGQGSIHKLRNNFKRLEKSMKDESILKN